MNAYVIKSWKASNQPVDTQQNLVYIQGRADGIVSWLLSLMKIDPTVQLSVSAEQVKFSASSLSGSAHRIIPIENICSTYYGYHKPWMQALAIAVFVSFAIIASRQAEYWLACLIGLVLAIAYYFLSKTLTLGFVENSGVVNTIAFKRSVIEGQNIDETSAAYVADLTQALIDNRKSSRRGV